MEFKDLFTEADSDLSQVKKGDIALIVFINSKPFLPKQQRYIESTTEETITLSNGYIYDRTGKFLTPEGSTGKFTRLYRNSDELTKRINSFKYRELRIHKLALSPISIGELMSSEITSKELNTIINIYKKYIGAFNNNGKR